MDYRRVEGLPHLSNAPLLGLHLLICTEMATCMTEWIGYTFIYRL